MLIPFRTYLLFIALVSWMYTCSGQVNSTFDIHCMCDGAARISLNIVPGKYVSIGSAVTSHTNWWAVYYFRINRDVEKYSFDVIAGPTSRYSFGSVDYGYFVNVIPYSLNAVEMRSAMFGGHGNWSNTNVLINDWFKWVAKTEPLIKPIVDGEIRPLLNYKYFDESSSIVLYQTDKESDFDAMAIGVGASWRDDLIKVPNSDLSVTPVGGVLKVRGKECIIYYSKKGERLESISKAFHVPKEKILQMNPVLNVNSTMSNGQSIIIPVPENK